MGKKAKLYELVTKSYRQYLNGISNHNTHSKGWGQVSKRRRGMKHLCSIEPTTRNKRLSNDFQVGGEKTYWGNKWTAEKRYHRPVKSQDTHAQAGRCSEQSVHDDIVRSNPAYPVEHAQPCEKISGNPVPDKTADHSNEEKALAAEVSVGLAITDFVKGVEQS